MLSNLKNGENLVELEMVETDFFWAAYCHGIAIGDTKTKNTYRWGPTEDKETEVD